MKAILFDIRRFTIHDGPGIRTTVFFKGCPLSCWWCHNPESRLAQPEQWVRKDILEGKEYERVEKVGYPITVNELLPVLLKDQLFWEESGGGVTLSGGEPLQQAAFLNALIPQLKKNGIHVALDTCGFTSSEVIMETATKADLVLYDIKVMQDELHKHYTGVSRFPIHKNLTILSESDTDIILRHPVIPGINTSQEEEDLLLELLSHIKLKQQIIHLLPYHSMASNKYTRPGYENKVANLVTMDFNSLEPLKHRIENLGWTVCIGG